LTILNSNIKLVQDANIFLTKLETITVTVNCMGIMGKGVALVAKDLAPDMFEFYKKLCENKKMQLGKPVIFDKSSKYLKSATGETKKMLLFPTKNHWRTNSSIMGIKNGLEWLVDNYKSCKIESLAIPALGCGNGGLDWKTVGPMLYQHLIQLNIPVELYLPTKKISKEYLEEDYLMSEPKKITDF